MANANSTAAPAAQHLTTKAMGTIEDARARVEAHDAAQDVALEFVGRIRDRNYSELNIDIEQCVDEITELLSGERGDELRNAVKATLRAEMLAETPARAAPVKVAKTPTGRAGQAKVAARRRA